MADQNGENDRSNNKKMRKTKNKTSNRVHFESLITNMAFFVFSLQQSS